MKHIQLLLLTLFIISNNHLIFAQSGDGPIQVRTSTTTDDDLPPECYSADGSYTIPLEIQNDLNINDITINISSPYGTTKIDSWQLVDKDNNIILEKLPKNTGIIFEDFDLNINFSYYFPLDPSVTLEIIFDYTDSNGLNGEFVLIDQVNRCVYITPHTTRKSKTQSFTMGTFKDKFVFNYSIDQINTFVNLVLIDVQTGKSKTLFSEYQPSTGEFQYKLSNQSLPTGIFAMKITRNRKVDVIKFINVSN